MNDLYSLTSIRKRIGPNVGKSTFRDYKNEHNNSSWKEHFNLDGLLEFLNSKITIGIIFTTKEDSTLQIHYLS